MKHLLMIFGLSTMLSACAAQLQLAPAPNIFREGNNYPEEFVPETLRTASPDIFYVTDRVNEDGEYGSKRSSSMAFGRAQVKFGRDLSWEELLEGTRADSNKAVSTLWVPEIEEIVRFEPTPIPFVREAGALNHVPEVRSKYDEQTKEFQDALRAKMRETGNNKVLVYVHGFNNDFDDSVTSLANLWHFTGRDSIPIAFTWPAGNGAGPLGYFRDRDAGTFAVHHTKEFFRMLADIPELAQIDIVAHSRGTEVVGTALREQMIFARGQGVHPKTAMKTGILIMAAPDVGIDIVRQRLMSERFSEAFEQVNLYVNPGDAALRLSAYLTRTRRLGALRDKDFAPGELELLGKEGLVFFIQVEDERGGLGHGYFRSNPAVLSDIVLALRTRAFPGGSLRPLERKDNGIWLIHKNYPLERLPDLGFLSGDSPER
ncbi:MAG: alpha/beta hydrolase [Paracoccaceae bacterium]